MKLSRTCPKGFPHQSSMAAVLEALKIRKYDRFHDYPAKWSWKPRRIATGGKKAQDELAAMGII